MRKFYTAEAVTEGHPDKVCDQIADAILDMCLKNDADSKVACEVLATKGTVIVAGEITSTYEADVFGVIQKVLSEVGYSSEGVAMDTFVHQQSPDIANAVRESKEKREGVSDNQMDWFQGAGDQGVMIGYACDETPQLMPMPVVLANRIVRELSACRRSSYIEGICPDGKAQVTVEYEDGKPVRLDSVVVSCQHTEDKNLKKLEAEIRKKVLLPALRLLPPDEDTKILINPSGRFVCGGMEADTGLTGRKLMVDSYGSMVPHGGGAFSGKDCSKVDRSGAYMARYIAKADTGLTGRKLMVDSYGSMVPHGGGAFSGKDCSKVDRSGAYMARYIAKNMVAAGLASKCQVSLAYAIGVAQPVMVQVDTFGTGKVCADDCLEMAIPLVFGLTPKQIVDTLRLTRPIFRQTAAFGHFGRKELPWERTDKVEQLRNAVI